MSVETNFRCICLVLFFTGELTVAFSDMDAAEQRLALTYKNNESAWQFLNGRWNTNDQRSMVCPATSHWSMDVHLAFQTEQAYGDCTLSGKWQFRYAGGAQPLFIVRAQDTRRFYAVRCNLQMNLPSSEEMIMCSIWKGTEDGYQRMLGYRRKVGIYAGRADPHRWYEVRVRCVGPQIVVYFDDNFVCAVNDADYAAGMVGVGGIGTPAFKDLEVAGAPVQLKTPWSDAETETPKQFKPVSGVASSAMATLLSDDEILLGFRDGDKQFVTRSRDYGLTWDKPVQGSFGYYIASLNELWSIRGEHNPDVVWKDGGTNFDELNPNNFWHIISISRDLGRTWSPKKRLAIPFPAGVAYQPIKGEAGAVVGPQGPPRDLGDGAVAMTGSWRNNPDGNYHSDQNLFFRSTDGGRSWSMSYVDATEWERNESGWVELGGGRILAVLRSNYTNSVGQSISEDYGRTWSKVRPLGIPFFGASAPSILRTRNNVLVLATRQWGIFTSIDDGQTWSLPTHIRGYSGSGLKAGLLEMKDGRLLVFSSTHGNARKNCTTVGQFIRVDTDGMVHPALLGPYPHLESTSIESTRQLK